VSADRRLTALRITTAIAFLCGLGLSWRLWTSARLFPLAPVSDALPLLPPPIDGVLFFALIALLLATAIVPRSRVPVIASLVVALGLGVLDQTRWQPWFYQYVVMLVALAQRGKDPLDTCRIIVAFTYVWSGLQKLNATFVDEMWPDFAQTFFATLSPTWYALQRPLGLSVPIIECVAGVGLLTRRFRTQAIVLAVAIHGAVLALLLSSRENTVVWPWNVAMPVFVIILFGGDRETSARDLLVPRGAFQLAVVVLFGVMPALNIAGLWPSYLSVALYSGNTKQAVIYLGESTFDRLPRGIRRDVWQGTTPFFLDINRWAYDELNVPAFPEAGVYRRVTERVCEWGAGTRDIRLRIKSQPHPLTGARTSGYYDCNHLREIR